jgi:hypothetical protein
MNVKELRKLIKEEISKVSPLDLNINDLFYNLRNSEDMTMAGEIDNYLIQNKYNNDSDLHDAEDGYSLRDQIISELTQGLELKLQTLLKKYSS